MDKIVDLHIHSYYSDGTMTIKEILENAVSKNVGILSVTDHNILEGSIELLKLCNYYNIKCISGVELDSEYKDSDIHILGYGCNFNNNEFIEFVKENCRLLQQLDIILVRKLEKDCDKISLEEFKKYTYNRRRGGWEGLNYLIDKKLITDIYGYLKIFEKYNLSYTSVKFPNVKEVCRAIHKAGGKAVLAHPGRVIPFKEITEFKKEILSIVSMGIDGIECYYPSHSKEIISVCLDICNKNNLIITCGSDSHGEYTGDEIGTMSVRIEDINILNKLGVE